MPSAAPSSERGGSAGVVQPLSRAAERPCARPGCPAPARATLVFAYASREAVLERLTPAADPQAYDLCITHAGRTDPPRGWSLTDRRPTEDRTPPQAPKVARDLGGDATVAVLAAALRAVPEPPVATADVAATVEREGAQTAVESPESQAPTLETTAELPRVGQPRPVPAAVERATTRH